MKKKAIIFSILFVLFVSLLLLYSRFIGTTGLNINEYKLKYNNLSKDFYGFKIAHITDIHYGRTINDKELENIVKKINLTKPDLVFFTGDLIDKDTKLTTKNKKNIIEILSKIDVTIDKYYITGNHDYKNKDYDSIMTSAGFRNLNNNYDLIYPKGTDYILISGISTSLYGKESSKEKIQSTIDYLNNSEIKPNYSILLIHEPDIIDSIDFNKFNLVLAGHSHGGQIRLPILGPLYTPPYAKKYYDSHYKISDTNLYISSGIGVSTINYRLNNPPSINFYRIFKEVSK